MLNMCPRLVVLAVALAGTVMSWSAVAQEAAQGEPSGQRDARMAWWRDARFGLFIHFGLFSLPTEDPHRMDSYFQVPLTEFRSMMGQFNPVAFDADAWAAAAAGAGMKYVVFVTKSHDGFCLWDSAYTDFDVMATPFKRDIVKELADACRRHGLRIGWYYSIMDWSHPDYVPRREVDGPPEGEQDFGRYVEYMKNQIRELLTKYGPIDVMWFDGEWDASWTPERGKDLDAFVRSLQPSIIVNNRVDKGRRDNLGMTAPGGYAGDFGTPEQVIPESVERGVDWEACMTTNDHWQFVSYDQNWKSPEALVRMLADCASKGGNLLLDVGPEPSGVFPQAAVERLGALGKWLRVNGEAIYGTQAGPFPERPAWGMSTMRPLPEGGKRVYLLVCDWPADGRLRVAGLAGHVEKAFLLADPEKRTLETQTEGGGLMVDVPAAAPDSAVSVVVVDVAGGA